MGVSFPCEIDDHIYRLINVVSYQEKPYFAMRGKSVMIEDEKITFSCADGYIECEVKV